MEKKTLLEQIGRPKSQFSQNTQNFDYNLTVNETEGNKPVVRSLVRTKLNEMVMSIGVLNPPLKVVNRTTTATPSCSRTTPSTSANARSKFPVVRYQTLQKIPYRLVSQKVSSPKEDTPNRPFAISSRLVNINTNNSFNRMSYQNQTLHTNEQNQSSNFAQTSYETPDTSRTPVETPKSVLKSYYSVPKGYETNQSDSQNTPEMTKAENMSKSYGRSQKQKSIKIFRKNLTALDATGDSTKKLTPSSSVSNFLEQDILEKGTEVLESLDDNSLNVLIRKVMDLTNKMYGEYLAEELEKYLGVEKYREIAEHGLTSYHEFLARKHYETNKDNFSPATSTSEDDNKPEISVFTSSSNAGDTSASNDKVQTNFVAGDKKEAQTAGNITVHSVTKFTLQEKDDENLDQNISVKRSGKDQSCFVNYPELSSVFDRTTGGSPPSTHSPKLEDTVNIDTPKDVILRDDAQDIAAEVIAQEEKTAADIFISEKIAELKKIGYSTPGDNIEEIFTFDDSKPNNGLPDKIFESPDDPRLDPDTRKEAFQNKCQPRKLLQVDGIEGNGTREEMHQEETTVPHEKMPELTEKVGIEKDVAVNTPQKGQPASLNTQPSKLPEQTPQPLKSGKQQPYSIEKQFFREKQLSNNEDKYKFDLLLSTPSEHVRNRDILSTLPEISFGPSRSAISCNSSGSGKMFEENLAPSSEVVDLPTKKEEKIAENNADSNYSINTTPGQDKTTMKDNMTNRTDSTAEKQCSSKHEKPERCRVETSNIKSINCEKLVPEIIRLKNLQVRYYKKVDEKSDEKIQPTNNLSLCIPPEKKCLQKGGPCFEISKSENSLSYNNISFEHHKKLAVVKEESLSFSSKAKKEDIGLKVDSSQLKSSNPEGMDTTVKKSSEISKVEQKLATHTENKVPASQGSSMSMEKPLKTALTGVETFQYPQTLPCKKPLWDAKKIGIVEKGNQKQRDASSNNINVCPVRKLSQEEIKCLMSECAIKTKSFEEKSKLPETNLSKENVSQLPRVLKYENVNKIDEFKKVEDSMPSVKQDIGPSNENIRSVNPDSTKNSETHLAKVTTTQNQKSSENVQHRVTVEKGHEVEALNIHSNSRIIKAVHQNPQHVSSVRQTTLMSPQNDKHSEAEKKSTKFLKDNNLSPDLETSMNDLAQLLVSLQDLPTSQSQNSSDTSSISNESFELFAKNTVKSLVIENDDCILIDDKKTLNVTEETLTIGSTSTKNEICADNISKNDSGVDDKVQDIAQLLIDFQNSGTNMSDVRLESSKFINANGESLTNDDCVLVEDGSQVRPKLKIVSKSDKHSAGFKSSTSITTDSDDCVLVEIESGPGTENLYRNISSSDSKYSKSSPCASAKQSFNTSYLKEKFFKKNPFGISSEHNYPKSPKTKTIMNYARSPFSIDNAKSSVTTTAKRPKLHLKAPADQSKSKPTKCASSPSFSNIAQNTSYRPSKSIANFGGKTLSIPDDIDVSTSLASVSKKFPLLDVKIEASNAAPSVSKEITLPEVSIELASTSISVSKKSEIPRKKFVFQNKADACGKAEPELVKNKFREEFRNVHVERTRSHINTKELEMDPKFVGNKGRVYGSMKKNTSLSAVNVDPKLESIKVREYHKSSYPKNIPLKGGSLHDGDNSEDDECILVGVSEPIVETPLSRKSGDSEKAPRYRRIQKFKVHQQRNYMRMRVKTLSKMINKRVKIVRRTYDHFKMLVNLINYNIYDVNLDNFTLKCKIDNLKTIYNQVNKTFVAFKSKDVRDLKLAFEKVRLAHGQVRFSQTRIRKRRTNVVEKKVAEAGASKCIAANVVKNDKIGGDFLENKLFVSPHFEEGMLVQPEKTYSKARKSILKSMSDSKIECTKNLKKYVFPKSISFFDEIRKSSLDRNQNIEENKTPDGIVHCVVYNDSPISSVSNVKEEIVISDKLEGLSTMKVGDRPPSPEMVIVKSEPPDSPEIKRKCDPLRRGHKRKTSDKSPSKEKESPTPKRRWSLRGDAAMEFTPPSKKKKEASSRSCDFQRSYTLRSRSIGNNT